MSILVEMETKQLSELQQHMDQLVKYYESDVAALGRMGEFVTGDALKALEELIQIRLNQLNSADRLWDMLTQK